MLLVVIASLSIIFSIYQKSQADISTERAVKLQRDYEECHDQSKKKEYEVQQQLAMTNSQLATVIQQLQTAQEELKKKNSKSK